MVKAWWDFWIWLYCKFTAEPYGERLWNSVDKLNRFRLNGPALERLVSGMQCRVAVTEMVIDQWHLRRFPPFFASRRRRMQAPKQKRYRIFVCPSVRHIHGLMALSPNASFNFFHYTARKAYSVISVARTTEFPKITRIIIANIINVISSSW